jgi:hypothetical protein
VLTGAVGHERPSVSAEGIRSPAANHGINIK